MNVLLCLLSDQHVPNLLSVHHLKPDRLILLESEDMQRKSASRCFLDALKAGGLDYSDMRDIVSLDRVADFPAIQNALRSAYGKYPDARWTVNLTGGTKPMSIAAYEFFKALGARLLYVEANRPNEFRFFDTGTTETGMHNLTIKEFITGYGFSLSKPKDKVRQAEDRARRWGVCAREIARTASDQDLLILGDSDRDKARKKGLNLQPGQLTPSDPQLRERLAKTFSLQTKNNSLVGCLDRHACGFLTGGWLEVFVWGVLDKHTSALDLRDVRLGIEVAKAGDTASGSIAPGQANDLDVAFIHNYGLHVVECKSGAQSHDPKADALYKIEAVLRQYRALRVRSYLVTTSSNVLDRTGQIEDSIRNRAEIYGCRVITRGELKRLADRADDAGTVKEIFFGEPGPT
ncbi:MAG: DUF1887 family protein [Planctomycetota bacterium]|nr:DUF1887 family protein [Planctomycetota bacterium]